MREKRSWGAKASLFRHMHKEMINGAKAFLHLRWNYDYYACVYGWVPGFVEDLKKYSNKSDKNAYLAKIADIGLRPLEMNRNGEGSIKIQNKEYEIPEDMNFRISAVKYLKEVVKKTYPNINIPQTYNKVKEIVTIGIGAIEDKDADIKHLFERQCTQGDIYLVWLNLLIYADRGKYFLYGQRDNIYMASKRVIQDLYPLEGRVRDAKRIVIINYAGTSLLKGQGVSMDYNPEWRIFFEKLLLGKTEINIVLTDPDSAAATDAQKYKMRPYIIRTEKANEEKTIQNIIPENIEEVKRTIELNPKCNISLSITDVALPCAYFKSEFEDPKRNNIKIDLYLPSFAQYGESAIIEDKVKVRYLSDLKESDELLRQSFMIFYDANPELYEVFSRNMENILKNSQSVITNQ